MGLGKGNVLGSALCSMNGSFSLFIILADSIQSLEPESLLQVNDIIADLTLICFMNSEDRVLLCQETGILLLFGNFGTTYIDNSSLIIGITSISALVVNQF